MRIQIKLSPWELADTPGVIVLAAICCDRANNSVPDPLLKNGKRRGLSKRLGSIGFGKRLNSLSC